MKNHTRSSSSTHVEKRRCRSTYRRPQLRPVGPVGTLICGASWKGVDSNGQIAPPEAYPS